MAKKEIFFKAHQTNLFGACIAVQFSHDYLQQEHGNSYAIACM